MRCVGVVGLVARDIVDGAAPRVGGAVFYGARALRALPQPGAIATKFAERDRALVEPLHTLGVPVAWRPARATLTFRIDNRDGDRDMAIEELGESWTPDEARGWVGEALADAAWVHAGALTRADFPAETLAELRRGRILSLDGQGLVRRAKTGPLEVDSNFDPAVLEQVDVLKLAEPEAAALRLELTTTALASLGVREVVVTLAERGALVCASGSCEHVPTRPLRNLDTTGAGDVFMTAYAASRLARHGPTSAARFANALTYGVLCRKIPVG